MATEASIHAIVNAPGNSVLTVTWIARELNVTCVEARAALTKYIEKHAEKGLQTLVTVVGMCKAESASPIVVAVVPQHALEETRSTLASVLSEELYGVYASGIMDVFSAAAQSLSAQAKVLALDGGAKGKRFQANGHGAIVADIPLRAGAARLAPALAAPVGGGAGAGSLGKAGASSAPPPGAAAAGSLGAKKPGGMAAFLTKGSSSVPSAPAPAPAPAPASKNIAGFFGGKAAAPSATPAPGPAPAPSPPAAVVDKKKNRRVVADDDDDEDGDANFDHAAFDLERDRKAEEEEAARLAARAAAIAAGGKVEDDGFDVEGEEEEEEEEEEAAGEGGANTAAAGAGAAATAGSTKKPRKPKAEGGEPKPRKPRGPPKPKPSKYATFMVGDSVVGGGAEIAAQEAAGKQGKIGFKGGAAKKRRLVETTFTDEKGFLVTDSKWVEEDEGEGQGEGAGAGAEGGAAAHAGSSSAMQEDSDDDLNLAKHKKHHAPATTTTSAAMEEDSDDDLNLAKPAKKKAPAPAAAEAGAAASAGAAPAPAPAKPAATKQSGLMGFFGKK